MDDLLHDDFRPHFDPPAAPGALDQGAIFEGGAPPEEDNYGEEENESHHEMDEMDNDEDEGDREDDELNADGGEYNADDVIEYNLEDDNNGEDDHENQGAQNAPEIPQAQEGHRPYNLRPRVGANNQFKEAMDDPHSSKSYFPPMQLVQQGTQLTTNATDRSQYIFGYIMNQMTAKVGIKKHGKAAEAALMKEFAQLEDLNVYESINPRSLTMEQK